MKIVKHILCLVLAIILLGCKNDTESNIDKKIKDIEQKHGIKILYGDDVIGAKSISDIELLDDKDRVMKALEEIDEYFLRLPDGFVEELTSMGEISDTHISIVIANDTYIGISYENDSEEYWVLYDKKIDLALAENTMHSVIYHSNHTKEDSLLVKDWKKYNPDGFVYGITENNQKYLYEHSRGEDCYFVIEDSMENLVYELKTLFVLMWDRESMENYRINELPRIYAKMQYLCSELDRVFETVDENAYWARYIKYASEN